MYLNYPNYTVFVSTQITFSFIGQLDVVRSDQVVWSVELNLCSFLLKCDALTFLYM